MLLYIDKFMN